MNNNQIQPTNQPKPNRFRLKTWQWVSVLAVLAVIAGGVFILMNQSSWRIPNHTGFVSSNEIPEIYPDGSYSIIGIKKNEQNLKNQSVEIKGIVEYKADCGYCPSDALCKTCQLYILLVDPVKEATLDHRETVFFYVDINNNYYQSLKIGEQIVVKVKVDEYGAVIYDTSEIETKIFQEGDEVLEKVSISEKSDKILGRKRVIIKLEQESGPLGFLIQSVNAQTDYPFQDKPIGRIDMWEETIAFSAYNQQRNQDIYLYSIVNETLEKISTEDTDDFHPAIYKDLIVWGESKKEVVSGLRVSEDEKSEDFPRAKLSYKIVLYNTSTKEKIIIPRDHSIQSQLPSDFDIYGNYIVWEEQFIKDKGTNYIYLYNINNKQVKRIDKGEGIYPAGPHIWNDKVVWYSHFSDSGQHIVLYDISKDKIYKITKQEPWPQKTPGGRFVRHAFPWIDKDLIGWTQALRDVFVYQVPYNEPEKIGSMEYLRVAMDPEEYKWVESVSIFDDDLLFAACKVRSSDCDFFWMPLKSEVKKDIATAYKISKNDEKINMNTIWWPIKSGKYIAYLAEVDWEQNLVIVEVDD